MESNTLSLVEDSAVLEYLASSLPEEKLLKITKSLTAPPKFTTIRVNTTLTSVENAKDLLAEHLRTRYTIFRHDTLSDVLVVSGELNCSLDTHEPSVIVDRKCGKAVLRGADVFAPGVKGMPHLAVGRTVSVRVDKSHRCKRGEKKFTGDTVHIGNGIIELTRTDIFKRMVKSGVAVRVTERRIAVPPLNGFLPDLLFLQNLPSIVASHALSPRPGDRVLDMCAAPGGKTTHIAQLMGGRGEVVALEKVRHKVEELRGLVSRLGLDSCISVHQWDSTEAYCPSSTSTTTTPPFGENSFDRVLVDVPCSALGQRPQLSLQARLREISSYPAYQWRFLADAARMCRVGGTLIYSTCSLPAQENEGLVARLLRECPDMELVRAEPYLGEPGLPEAGLSPDQCGMVQRFTPDSDGGVNSDTIGFFLAKFAKRAM